MFSTEIRVGRLYEHRIETLESEEELASLAHRGQAVMGASPVSVVVCADYRSVRYMKAELTAQFIAFLSRVNPKIERSAVLIQSDQAVFGLQISRMVRESGNPNRRIFKDPLGLESWLGEVLTAAERARLTEFLQVSS